MQFMNATVALGQGPYANVLRVVGRSNPTGYIWFVNSLTGSNANGGTAFDIPFATLAYALSVGAAGDTFVLLPGFTVTLTAVQALALAGISLIGIGEGSLKPTITVNAAADGLSLTAANILVHNVNFAPPETDNATAMINVAAAGCRLSKISGIGSKTAKNFVDCITIAAGADDLTVEELEIYNSVVAVNSFISIEAAVNRLKLFDVFGFGDCATAGIIDSAKALQIHLRRVTIGTVGTTIPAIILDSNPTGLAENCNFSGTSTTLADNANLGNLMRLFDVKVLEETDNSKQGALIPAVDAD